MSTLAVKGLVKAFGDTQAVRGVDFEVNPGEIYGLLGPNGAGKTTTISMICGLLRNDQGEIRINGAELWSNPSAAQRAMGVVPQEIALYEELSGLDNLIFWGKLAGMSGKEAKPRAAELLEMLTLSERGREAVKHYSGGMKRRINIGCALMHKPDLVLMDEPTVGIDPQARMNILEFVKNLAADGTAVLYTTHYLEEAETLCDRVGVIDQGKLFAEGTLEELQARLGGEQLFVLEGAFGDVTPGSWDGFRKNFNLVHQSDSQLIAASAHTQDPADSLRILLDLPIKVENVHMKKPNLNDVFIHLTGKDLRE